MKRNSIIRGYRYIIHRIFNERRSNCTLLAELLVVSCIIWYIVDCAYVIVTRALESTGFDTTNCYRLDFTRLSEDNAGYDLEHPDSAEINTSDFLALADRIRHIEDIEFVGYSWRNDPYQGALYTTQAICDTVESSPIRMITCDPDFLKVFRYKGANGETPEQLAAMLKDRNALISQGAFGEEHNINKMIGKELKIGMSFNKDTLPYRLAGVFIPVKRFSFEEKSNIKEYIIPINSNIMENNITNLSISIRVKDNHMEGFTDRFREQLKGMNMRAGNYYISGFHSYDELKKDSETEQKMNMRNYTVVIIFLLINVFLGLLGTFWIRTQHRFPEIGLQKAIGATNTDITLKLLAEAMLLMTIAFILSLIIDFNIAHANLTEYYNGETLAAGRFAVCAVISYMLMTAIIGLGIWFPALRAARTRPVDVLRGE